jgi:membrane protein
VPGSATVVRDHLRRLHGLIVDSDLDAEENRHSRWPIYVVRLLMHVGRQWVKDRCPSQASALSFETALSLVPSIAVAFALLKATGFLEARSALVEFLSSSLFPVYGERFSQVLVQFSDNINAGVLGAAGSAFTFAIAYFVFHELEHIFNDIWRVTQRRPLVGKFVIFYTLITLAPTLVGLSLFHTAHYWRANKGAIGWILPVLSVWFALVLANRLLPRTKVKWGHAAAGALISALLFEVAKRLFALYLSDIIFKRYTGIYGALALLPLLLMWIYFTWLVVLLGAEVTYALQNFRALEAVERRRNGGGPEARINGVVAARLLYEIARAFHDGRKAISRLDLARRYELQVEIVIAIMERLKRANLVVEVEGDVSGYMLARAPTEISLEAVFDPFGTVDTRAGTEADGRLNEILRELEAARRTTSERVTFADLLARRVDAAAP